MLSCGTAAQRSTASYALNHDAGANREPSVLTVGVFHGAPLPRLQTETARVSILPILATQYEWLGDHFQEAMRVDGPQWSLIPARGRQPSNREHSLLWRSGEETVSVTYLVLDTPQEAVELIRQRRGLMSIPSREISGFGDESFSFMPLARDYQTLWLRRGRVILELRAYGEAQVQRFARLFLGVVERNIPQTPERPHKTTAG